MQNSRIVLIDCYIEVLVIISIEKADMVIQIIGQIDLSGCKTVFIPELYIISYPLIIRII